MRPSSFLARSLRSSVSQSGRPENGTQGGASAWGSFLFFLVTPSTNPLPFLARQPTLVPAPSKPADGRASLLVESDGDQHARVALDTVRPLFFEAMTTLSAPVN